MQITPNYAYFIGLFWALNPLIIQSFLYKIYFFKSCIMRSNSKMGFYDKTFIFCYNQHFTSLHRWILHFLVQEVTFYTISVYRDLFLTAEDFCLHIKPPDASRSHIVCSWSHFLSATHSEWLHVTKCFWTRAGNLKTTPLCTVIP